MSSDPTKEASAKAPSDIASPALEIARIEMTPPVVKIAVGTSPQLRVTAILANGGVADVTDYATLERASDSIRASFRSFSAQVPLFFTDATLTSVVVTPANPNIALGFTQAFIATGTFSDGTTQNITSDAKWATSNGAVASILDDPINSGLAAAAKAGTTTISAAVDATTDIPLSGGAQTGSTTLTVSAATMSGIGVIPQNSSLLHGSTRSYSAIGMFSDATTQNLTTQVDWSSSDSTVVGVSNTGSMRGVATANRPGSATITAAASNKVTGTTAVTVLGSGALVSIAITPDPATVGVGNIIALTASGTFRDGDIRDITASVTWSSTAPNIAVVSNVTGANGKVTGLQPGAGIIRAAAANSTISATVSLTVSAAILEAMFISPPGASLVLPAIAHQQFAATGIFDDGSTHDFTTQAAWSSSDPSVATISNAAGSQGLLTPNAAGSTTVGAKVPGTAVSATTLLTVTTPTASKMTIVPTNDFVAIGRTKAFHALVTFSDGSRADMTSQATWTSSLPAVLGIISGGNGAGTASGLTSGTATLTATVAGLSASTSVQVSLAQLMLIATSKFGTTEENHLSAYLIDSVTGALEFVQSVPLPGSFDTGLALAVSLHKMVVCVVSTRNNAVYSFKIGNDGRLTAGNGSPHMVASNAGQFTGPYSALFDATGTYFYTVNFSGSIAGFSIGSSTAALTELTQSPFAAPAPQQWGAQLQHSAFSSMLYAVEVQESMYEASLNTFTIEGGGALSPSSGIAFPSPGTLVAHPRAPFAYFVNQRESNIQGYWAGGAGALTPLSFKPTPTAGGPQFLAAAIDPDGRFLYVASMRLSTVAVFAISGFDGALTQVSGSPFSVGVAADGLTTSPHGDFLYVSDAYTSNVFGFRVDTVTGGILGQLKNSPFATATFEVDFATIQLPAA